MPALSRMVSIRGPRFWRDGDKLMFVNHLDASTRDGPREASAADIDAFADAFEAFEGEDTGAPLGPLVSFKTPQINRTDTTPDRPHARRRDATLQKAL